MVETKQPISKETLWGLAGIICFIVALVFPMKWWFQLLLLGILAVIIVFLIDRSKWTINWRWYYKGIISVIALSILTVVSWNPVKDQWLRDHPISSSLKPDEKQLPKPPEQPPVIAKPETPPVMPIPPKKEEPIAKTPKKEELNEALKPENIMTTIEKWINGFKVKYEKIDHPNYDFLFKVQMRNDVESDGGVLIAKKKKESQYIIFTGVIALSEKDQRSYISLLPTQQEQLLRNLRIEVDRLKPASQAWKPAPDYELLFGRGILITNDLTEDVFSKMLTDIDSEKDLLIETFHRDLKQLQKEVDESLPNLHGRIVLFNKIMSPNEKDLGILLSVYIWNSGADSAIRGYWAEVAFGDEVFTLDPYVLPEKGITLSDDQGNPTRTFTSSDALELKTLTPIKKGDVRTGVLFFIIKDGIRFKDMKSKWKLFFRDYLGRVSGIYAEFGKQVEPDLVVPGATGSEPKKTE